MPRRFDRLTTLSNKVGSLVGAADTGNEPAGALGCAVGGSEPGRLTPMVATSPYGYAPAQRDPTAVVGRRIGAFFIDALVALVVGVLLFFALADKVSVS